MIGNLGKLVIIGTVLLPSAAAAQLIDWSTWSENGHRYGVLMLDPGDSVFVAEQKAIAAGGYAATLTSEAENNFVFGLIDKPQYWVSQSDAWSFGPWMGAILEPGSQAPGTWRWNTDEAWTYSNWNPESGEPNGWPHEIRAHYHSRFGFRASTWNDLVPNDPTQPNSIVVEAVPEPECMAGLLAGFVLLGYRKRTRHRAA